MSVLHRLVIAMLAGLAAVASGAALTVLPPAAPAGAAGPALVVTPSTGLVNGQTVAVAGSGFVPWPSGPFNGELYECANVGIELSRYNINDWCDDLGVNLPVGQAGVFTVTTPVHQDLSSSLSYHCGRRPGDCLLVGLLLSRFGDVVGSEPISFADRAPTCTLSAVVTGPPKQLRITTQDTGSGLQSISPSKLVNSTISVPAFTPGTLDAVVVTATKVDQSKASTVALTVKDVGGHTTVCDPVLVTVVRGVGNATTLTGIARAEHVVTIRNGAPGLRAVIVSVNGSVFRVKVDPGTERSLDVGSAMRAGARNTIVISGRGPKQSSADVLVWDGNGTA